MERAPRIGTRARRLLGCNQLVAWYGKRRNDVAAFFVRDICPQIIVDDRVGNAFVMQAVCVLDGEDVVDTG